MASTYKGLAGLARDTADACAAAAVWGLRGEVDGHEQTLGRDPVVPSQEVIGDTLM